MTRHALEKSVTLLLIGLLLAALVGPALAENSSTQISIRIDGLSCPFCAYGVEKKLKRLEGAEGVRIDIDRGVVEITVAEGKAIAEEDLNKAVVDAGFTPREITYGSAQPQ